MRRVRAFLNPEIHLAFACRGVSRIGWVSACRGVWPVSLELLSAGPYLTVDDVAGVLRKHPRTMRDWIANGCVTERGRIHLEATKLGKSVLIQPERLELFEHRIRPVRRADLDLE